MVDGELILIDEVLTPDSSRFWPAEGYKAGQSQPSFDKQYLRDWLSGQPWDKTPAAACPAQGGGRSHPEQISRSLPHSDRLRACSLI